MKEEIQIDHDYNKISKTGPFIVIEQSIFSLETVTRDYIESLYNPKFKIFSRALIFGHTKRFIRAPKKCTKYVGTFLWP